MSRVTKIGNVAELLAQAKQGEQPNEYLLGLTVAQKPKEGVEVGDLMATYMPRVSEEELARRAALEAQKQAERKAKLEAKAAKVGFRMLNEGEDLTAYSKAITAHKSAVKKQKRIEALKAKIAELQE